MKTEDEDAGAEGARKARECKRIVDRDRRIMFKSKPRRLAKWAFLRGLRRRKGATVRLPWSCRGQLETSPNIRAEILKMRSVGPSQPRLGGVFASAFE
jgi:hypothetical protein